MELDLPTIEPLAGSKFHFVEHNGVLTRLWLGGEELCPKFDEEDLGMISFGIHIDIYKLVKKRDHRLKDFSMDLADIRVVGSGTPIQRFNSKRIFADIPIEGESYFIAQSPSGEVFTSYYDSKINRNNVVFIDQDWIFCWVVPEDSKFRFLELCYPRFSDKTEDIPLGGEGLEEIDAETSEVLIPEFKMILSRLKKQSN